MNLLQGIRPRKPFVLGSGKQNKYHPTSLDGHRVLKNGSIVVRTISVGGVNVGKSYDEEMIKIYNANMKSYKDTFVK